MVAGIWQASIVDDNGDVITNAQIEVRRETAGSPLATIYQDRDATVALGNPFNANAAPFDSSGFVYFYAAGGAYKITATSGAFSRTWRYVPVGLAAEGDGALGGIGYRFNTATADADPGSGYLSFNNSDPASATEIYVSIENNNGADIEAYLQSIDDSGTAGNRGQLRIESSDKSSFALFQVTNSVTADGSPSQYYTLTVTPLGDVGAFTGDQLLSFDFSQRGIDTIAGVGYQFSTATADADPGSGYLSFNNSDLSLASEVYVSVSNEGGADVETYLQSIDDSGTAGNRGSLRIENSQRTAFVLFQVTGTVSPDGSPGAAYYTISVTPLGNSGSFSENELVGFDFSAHGGGLSTVSATERILGRKSAGSGAIEECTLDEILAFAGTPSEGDGLAFDGSNWAPVGTAVHLGEVIASSAAAVDITGLDLSNYRALLLTGSSVIPDTDAQDINVQYTQSSTTVDDAGSYQWNLLEDAYGSDGVSSSNGSSTRIKVASGVGTNAFEYCEFFLLILSPGISGDKKSAFGQSHYRDASTVSNWAVINSTFIANTDAIDGVHIVSASGNINGRFNLWGLSA